MGVCRSADILVEVPEFFLEDKAVLIGFEFVVDHLVDLFLEEVTLLVEEG